MAKRGVLDRDALRALTERALREAFPDRADELIVQLFETIPELDPSSGTQLPQFKIKGMGDEWRITGANRISAGAGEARVVTLRLDAVWVRRR